MISISDFENSFTKNEPTAGNSESPVTFFASIKFDKQNRATFSFKTENKYLTIEAKHFSGIGSDNVEIRGHIGSGT